MSAVRKDLLELPGIPFDSMPGVQAIPVHVDLQVLESNRLHGNTDPRFSELSKVQKHRAMLTGALACDRFVAMVPQISDRYEDLDREPIVAAREGYRLWPQYLQPVEDVLYDPDTPPRMIDLPADGLITKQPGNSLMLSTADCAATVMYDPRQRALALVHIGREGAVLDIGPKIVRHLQQTYDTEPSDLIVHFGASIAPESYVLPELREPLCREAWRPYRRETANGLFEIDIVGYAMSRLLEYGVAAENITRSEINVYDHPDYFSFVEHKQSEGRVANGRNGLLAVIR